MCIYLLMYAFINEYVNINMYNIFIYYITYYV